MELLSGDIRRLFWKYLAASVMGAVVTSVYSFVDVIAIGQSEGPAGTAAMAVIVPLYGIMVFFAVTCGAGGAVLMGNARGRGDNAAGDSCFGAALALIGAVTAAVWIALALFHRRIFTLFGADEQMMPKVLGYGRWVILAVPVFMLPHFIGAFIRNDGNPSLVTAAVISGGVVNALGDWLFVFPLGMGMEGAAVATVLGTLVQGIVMGTHFLSRRCRLRPARPRALCRTFARIILAGFGAGVLELGNVVLTVAMNNQIMRYGDMDRLAVYGLIVTVGTLFQSLFNGVGQGIQPIVSANCGADLHERILSVWRRGLFVSLAMGAAFVCAGELFPAGITRLFMDATDGVLAAAPGVFRPYFPMFLFLGITTLSTYYLQSLLHERMSLAIALLRSMALSVPVLLALPRLLGILGVWLAVPVSELAVSALALAYIASVNRALRRDG